MVAMLVRKVVKTEVEAPGLGARLKRAQRMSGKTIAEVLREVEISRTYWNSLVSEKVDSVSYDLLKKIEAATEADFEIDMD